MADINFNNVAIASAVNGNDYAHITTSGGTHNRVLIQKIIDLAKAGALDSVNASILDKYTAGCYIMYHRAVEGNGDNYPVACLPSAWTAKQNNGEIADGVLLVEGGHHLVIAPTGSAKINWGSVGAQVFPSGNELAPYTDRTKCFADFNGKARTAGIIAHASYSGDGTDYAPAFCNSYSRLNSNSKGLQAGRWWLPSIGELLMMWANKTKINACLQLITGATTIPNDAHWSSTESSATNAWRLYFSDGYLSASTKATGSYYVRPVSAFLN